MLELYIVIGILILIIFSLFIMLIKLFKINEEKETKHHTRFLVMDTHNRSEKRYLTLLLLEAKGVNTGVNTTANLYKQYIEEHKLLDEVEKFSKEKVEKAKQGIKEK
jgi:hypothetical protein